MANPQVDNGNFARISNDILDAFARTRIPGEARQVLDLIIRQTYGYSKKWDELARSQMILRTGLSRRSVDRAIQTLLDMNLVKKASGKIDKFKLNKDFDTWKTRAKKQQRPHFGATPAAKTQQRSAAKTQQTKERKKTTKDIMPEGRAKEIFCEEYLKYRKVKYDFEGVKDAMHIKRRLKTQDGNLDKWRFLLQTFFTMEDEFIKKSGYTLSVLNGCWQKVKDEAAKRYRIERYRANKAKEQA